MSKEVEFGANEEKLKTLHVSSLDEEEDDEAQVDEFDDPDLFTDEDEEDEAVKLGFVEKPKNKWSLLRYYFPSKAGGTPVILRILSHMSSIQDFIYLKIFKFTACLAVLKAKNYLLYVDSFCQENQAWLNPINLPSEKSSLCDFCSEPLQFLLQVYAPLSEESKFQHESTFHRALFVFMCPSMACLLHDQHEQWKRHPEKPCRSVKVFRCQLPHTNSFYSGNPPSKDGTEQPLTTGATLCNWCGTWKGDKVCSSCRKARYCSGKHQAAHWRSGHRLGCTQLQTSLEMSDSVASNSLWPQYEITSEDECEFENEMSDSEYSNILVSGNRVDESVRSLMDDFAGDDDKRSWASFQERISRAPEQVLRYCRSAKAKALWPVHSGRPSRSDIPACNYCGGTRCFEFQVLPQLLYYFGVQNDVDSLDWATIVVYTCEASCKGDEGYKEEFAWVQLVSQSAS